MTSVRNNNFLPPGLVSNLQEVLLSRKGEEGDQSNDNNTDKTTEPSTSSASVEDDNDSKPILLVTNGDGIESPGLVYLVEALVRQGLYNVHVCAPQSWVFIGFLFSFGFLLVSSVIYLILLSGLLSIYYAYVGCP